MALTPPPGYDPYSGCNSCGNCFNCSGSRRVCYPTPQEQMNLLLERLCEKLEVLENIDLDLDGIATLISSVESLKEYLEKSNANEEDIKAKLQDICDKVEALQQAIEDQTAALQESISEQTDSLNAATSEQTETLTEALTEQTETLTSAIEDQTESLNDSLSDISDQLEAAVNCLVEIKAALAGLNELLDTKLSSIDSKLDTVNSNLVGIQDILLSGEVAVQPGDLWEELLRQSFLENLPDLISALEGATFTVTGQVDVNINGIEPAVIDDLIASLEELLSGLVFDINVTNDVLTVTVDSIDPAVLQEIKDLIEAALGNVTVNVTIDPSSIQDIISALEDANLTVTIDTSAGPVQIEGTVTAVIDGVVQVEVTNFPTEISVNNFQDLVNLLENSTNLNVTVDALPPVELDATQLQSLIDAINNADVDDTDDDVRPDAPQCYCYTDPTSGELTYFLGTSLYDEVGAFISWEVLLGTPPPAGVDVQCADVKELQKISSTLEAQKALLESIDATLKGELTVSPNALWESLFEAAVTSSIENAQWPELEVTLNGETIDVSGTVALDQATLDALENITATIDASQLQSLIDAITAAVTLDPQSIADLVAALEAATLTVTVDGGGNLTVDGTVDIGNFADLVAALQGLNVTVDGTVELGQATLDALENITVTIDTTNGPVEVTGNVTATIDGTVQVEVTNFPTDFGINNFADLVSLLEASTNLNVTVDALPDVVIDPTQFQSLLDAIANADKDDTDDDLRPGSPQCYCYTDPVSGDLVYFAGTAQYNELGVFVGWDIVAGAAPPAGVEPQCADVKELQKISTLLESIDTTLKGEITVAPNSLWSGIFEAAVTSAIENAQWPELEVTLNGETIDVTGTVALDQASLDALENITATIDAAQLQSLIDAITADVNLSAASIADLVTALEAANLTVTVDGGNLTVDGAVDISNFADLVTALQGLNVVVSGTVDLGAATLAALENITVTVDTSAGPVEVTGNVTATIDGTVQVEVTNFPTDIAINNWADLVSLLEASTGLNVTVDALPDVVIDAAQFASLLDAIANADKDDTDDDVRPSAPGCYCYTDPTTGDLVYFFGVGKYDEVGTFTGWEVTAGTAPPAGVETQCADVKELQKQTALLESIDASLKGELTVAPNALWGTVFESAVTSAIENAQWPELEVTLNGETINVTGSVALDQATLDALENITATIDAAQLQSLIDAITADVNLSAASIADLITALEAANLTVTVNGGNITVDGAIDISNFADLVTALQGLNVVVSGTVDLGAATLAALENITVTIDTSAGPVEITGNVTATISGTVQTEVTNWPTDFGINNWADLVSLLEQSTNLNVTVDALPDIIINTDQFDKLIDTILNADKDDTDDDFRGVTPSCYCYDDGTGNLVEFVGYQKIDEAGNFVEWVVTSGTAPPAGTEVQCLTDKLLKEINERDALAAQDPTCLEGTTPGDITTFAGFTSGTCTGATWADLVACIEAEGCSVSLEQATSPSSPATVVDPTGLPSTISSPSTYDGVTFNAVGNGSFGTMQAGGVDYWKVNSPTGTSSEIVTMTFPADSTDVCYTFYDLETNENLKIIAYNDGSIIPWDDAWIVTIPAAITNVGGGEFTGTTFTSTPDTDADRSMKVCIPGPVDEVQFDYSDNVTTTGRNTLFEFSYIDNVNPTPPVPVVDSSTVSIQCPAGSTFTATEITWTGPDAGSLALAPIECMTCCEKTNELLQATNALMQGLVVGTINYCLTETATGTKVPVFAFVYSDGTIGEAQLSSSLPTLDGYESPGDCC